MNGRRPLWSVEERNAIASSLVGLSLESAERLAAKTGCSISDQTEPGWYTQPLDPHLVIVTVADGLILTAQIN